MTGDAKRELRRAGRERRAGRSREDRERAGDAIAGYAESVAGDTVALYAGIEAEPPTLRLVDRLLRRGTRIFLPILRSDMDLEWAPVESVDELITSSYGLLEPTRPSLGTRGICEVDLILAPGLAVDVSGVRLGQGGGCYTARSHESLRRCTSWCSTTRSSTGFPRSRTTVASTERSLRAAGSRGSEEPHPALQHRGTTPPQIPPSSVQSVAVRATIGPQVETMLP